MKITLTRTWVFLYASIILLKKENFKYLWWDTTFMKNIIQKRFYVFTSLLIGQTVNRWKRFAWNGCWLVNKINDKLDRLKR